MAAAGGFHILRTSDAEMLGAIESLCSDAAAKPNSIEFHLLAGGPAITLAPAGLADDPLLTEVRRGAARVFNRVNLKYGDVHLSIVRADSAGNRTVDRTGPTDLVEVNVGGESSKNPDYARLAELTAHFQKHFTDFRPTNLQAFLTAEAEQHYQARDSALSRLEKARRIWERILPNESNTKMPRSRLGVKNWSRTLRKRARSLPRRLRGTVRNSANVRQRLTLANAN
jgi:hypothetical protein